MKNNKDIKQILDILETTYPDARCALNHDNTFQLLIAVALSAQTTDKSVNKVTPLLFDKYQKPKDLADADQKDVENIIRTIGMYKTKSKNIIALSKKIQEEYMGKVPDNYDSLISLPGVGRKTANVVMSVGFGEERIAVDTHVFRVANRIGIAKGQNPLKTEISLMERLPKNRWSSSHHSLIFHGRECCHARKPDCNNCPINDLCDYYKE